MIAAAAGIENADSYKKAELINQLTGLESGDTATNTVVETVSEVSNESSEDKPKRKRTRVEKVEIGKKQPSLFSEEKPAIVAETPEVNDVVETKVAEVTETVVEENKPEVKEEPVAQVEMSLKPAQEENSSEFTEEDHQKAAKMVEEMEFSVLCFSISGKF